MQKLTKIVDVKNTFSLIEILKVQQKYLEAERIKLVTHRIYPHWD
jgi:hypothetical protein